MSDRLSMIRTSGTPRCCNCQRFVNADDAIQHIEYGDYGTVHSVEFECESCAAESRFEDVLREAFSDG